MSITLVSLVAILVFTIAAIVVGTSFVINRKLLKGAAVGPRCGHCSYNLTGSEANRCSECGRLFIEAGVLVPPGPEGLQRVRITMLRNGLIVGVVFVVLFGVVLLGVIATVQAQRAALAQARAIQAQAAAIAARAQAQLSAATQTAASHPADK